MAQGGGGGVSVDKQFQSFQKRKPKKSISAGLSAEAGLEELKPCLVIAATEIATVFKNGLLI